MAGSWLVRGRVLSGMEKGERDSRHRVCLEGACMLFVLLRGCKLYDIVMLRNFFFHL